MKLIYLVPFFLLLSFVFVKSSNNVTTKITPTITPTPTPHIFSEDKLWSLIQNWRTSQGLQPYIKDQRLCDIAKDRAHDMVLLDNQDDHEGFYKKYSNYPSSLQENTEYTWDEKIGLDQWLNSPSHKQALEKQYAYSCLACESIGRATAQYCSQIFSNLEQQAQSSNQTTQTIPTSNQVILSPIPTSNKTPIFVLGSVKQCLTDYIDVVKKAETDINNYSSQTNKLATDCYVKVNSNYQSCSSGCVNQTLYPNLSDQNGCYDQCRSTKSFAEKSCQVNDNYYYSLQDYLKKVVASYCN